MALSVSKDKLMTLVMVLLAHGLALYWAARPSVLPPAPTPKQVVMQAVVMMPVALPTKAVEPLPQPTPPKPVVQPKVQPQPMVQKTPVLPPSEKAITLEKTVVVEKNEPIVEKVSPTTVVNEPPIVSKVEAMPEPVVIPPRSDASGLNNPSPQYPNMSRRLAEQGKVLLEVLILANGTVGDIKIKQSSGYKRLDDAALQAVKQWQFLPAKRGNQAIDYWYVQPISFSLSS
ncbi:MAG: energy transducer TonB [Pseudomonadales bacterium]|nr:energy transducer TonB [Pseudomonadales bacterium]